MIGVHLWRLLSVGGRVATVSQDNEWPVFLRSLVIFGVLENTYLYEYRKVCLELQFEYGMRLRQ